MRYQTGVTVIVWATCSALVSFSLRYLGAGTAARQAEWPTTTVVGAAIGTLGAVVWLVARGDKAGNLLAGVAFAFIQVVVMSMIAWK